MTLSIMTLSVMQIIVTLSVICADGHIQALGMLNVIMLNVVMLSVVAPVFRVRAGNTKGGVSLYC
jgi:hypothetical protein